MHVTPQRRLRSVTITTTQGMETTLTNASVVRITPRPGNLCEAVLISDKVVERNVGVCFPPPAAPTPLPLPYPL